MLVLAIDTSTPTVTAGAVVIKRPHELMAQAAAPGRGAPTGGEFAAVLRSAATVLAERTVTDPFGHAEHLMPLVTSALGGAGRAIGDIEAVVVGAGPGPFTGLRVGMATAAALGDALGVPVHGVPSHDAMALRAAGTGDFLVATDARRREVYLSAYRASAARLHGPVVIAPADVPGLLTVPGLAPEWITGAGAGLLGDVLDLPVRQPDGQLSGFLVARAARQLLTGVVPGPLVPLYLRRPDATPPGAPKPVLGRADHVPAPPAPARQGTQR